MNLMLQELLVQRRAIQEHFEQYKVGMMAELKECLAFVRELSLHREGALGEDDDPWMLGTEAYAEWMELLRKNEVERIVTAEKMTQGGSRVLRLYL